MNYDNRRNYCLRVHHAQRNNLKNKLLKKKRFVAWWGLLFCFIIFVTLVSLICKIIFYSKWKISFTVYQSNAWFFSHLTWYVIFVNVYLCSMSGFFLKRRIDKQWKLWWFFYKIVLPYLFALVKEGPRLGKWLSKLQSCLKLELISVI
jgi:hypothetical protein